MLEMAVPAASEISIPMRRPCGPGTRTKWQIECAFLTGGGGASAAFLAFQQGLRSPVAHLT